jgi:hypothetical protein
MFGDFTHVLIKILLVERKNNSKTSKFNDSGQKNQAIFLSFVIGVVAAVYFFHTIRVCSIPRTYSEAFVVLGLSLTTRGKPTPLTFGKFCRKVHRLHGKV